MLHCGQQPFSYFVCLLFSAWHLVYSGFIFIFSFFTANSEIQQPAAAGFGVNNSTLCEPANPNTELEEASKLRRAADWGYRFLCVCHYEQPLSHYAIWSIVNTDYCLGMNQWRAKEAFSFLTVTSLPNLISFIRTCNFEVANFYDTVVIQCI